MLVFLFENPLQSNGTFYPALQTNCEDLQKGSVFNAPIVIEAALNSIHPLSLAVLLVHQRSVACLHVSQKSFNPRFGYDPEQESCVEFAYGGCKGNLNQFLSAEECTNSCEETGGTSRDMCLLPRSPGPCKDKLPKWYVRMSSPFGMMARSGESF